MKNLFLLFGLLLSSNLFSQITLTSSMNPVPGNTMLIIGCDTAGIVQGNAGANQTWSYTTLTRQDSTILNWVASSSTPYASQFPTSNVATKVGDSTFSYYTTSSSSILSDGIAGPGLVAPYTDPETFIQYPFTYNSNFTDNFSATFTSTGFTIYRYGTTTVTCDAWGTLNLPTGTFTNSIRLKYINVSTDSSNVSGFPIVIKSTNTSYAWFVGNIKFPVFQIGYNVTSINGAPPTSSKSVEFSPNNPTIGITQLNTNVPDNFKLNQNYPNPFNPATKIRFDIISNGRSSQSNVKLFVYDELGKEVAALVNEDLSPGSYEVSWNADNVSGGIYYYTLTTDNFTATKKMVLLK